MPDRKRTDYLVIHVSATKRSQKIGRKELVAMHKAHRDLRAQRYQFQQQLGLQLLDDVSDELMSQRRL